MLLDSEHANDIEVFVVRVLPEFWIAEVGIVQELSSALRPTNRLSLSVSVQHSRV